MNISIQMEKFVLGGNAQATEPVNLDQDVRIRSPEIVEGLTKSMEEGAKIHCKQQKRMEQFFWENF